MKKEELELIVLTNILTQHNFIFEPHKENGIKIYHVSTPRHVLYFETAEGFVKQAYSIIEDISLAKEHGEDIIKAENGELGIFQIEDVKELFDKLNKE